MDRHGCPIQGKAGSAIGTAALAVVGFRLASVRGSGIDTHGRVTSIRPVNVGRRVDATIQKMWREISQTGARPAVSFLCKTR